MIKFDNALSTDKASVTIFGEVPQEIITAGLLLSANMLHAKLVNPIIKIGNDKAVTCKCLHCNSHQIYNVDISWWVNGHFVFGQYLNNCEISKSIHFDPRDQTDFRKEIKMIFERIMEIAK